MAPARPLAQITAVLTAVLLSACGGGGDSGDGGGLPPLEYSGNTNAAVVTSTNASTLVDDLLGTSDVGQAVAANGLSVQGAAAQFEGHAGLARRLRDRLGDAVVQAERVNFAQRPAAGVIPVDETEPCVSGSVRRAGTLNDNGTGTLTVTFNQCSDGEVTLAGQATVRINAFDLGWFLPTDFTISFTRITLRGGGMSVDSGGSLSVQLNVVTLTETLVENVVELDNLRGTMTKSQNLVIVTVYDNLFSPSSISSTLTGRLFDSVHGFVDVTTLAPVAFGNPAQLFPHAGQVLLVGAGNRAVRALAQSVSLVMLEIDLDGDGGFDITSTLKWSDLSGPVGSDLLDSDGDGMHDSWETLYEPALDPNVADGAADIDGDGFSNLDEYRGGSDPTNVNSIPAMLVGPVFPVASGVSNAVSDTEVPGKAAIGSDGTDFLLVSCRELGPTTGVFGVRLSASGQVLGNFPIFGTACFPPRPAVAYDGANYLVVLSHGGKIVATRVAPAGNVLDGPDGIAISSSGTSNFHAAVGFDGANYLVVWMKFVGSIYWVYGATVTPAGVVSAEFPVSSGHNDYFPSVAFDGTNFLVVWTQTDQWDVHGVRVSPAATILDSPAIAIATLAGFQTATGVAFDGTNYLVIWDHQLSSGTSPPPDGAIYGRRVAPSGSPVDGAAGSDGIPLATGPHALHSSSLAFAGNHYVVTWAAGSFPNYPPAGIFATRVSKAGVRIDGAPDELGVPLSGTPLAYSRFVYPVAGSNGLRALVSWVDNVELSGSNKEIRAVAISGL